jgi:hypothetical protein
MTINDENAKYDEKLDMEEEKETLLYLRLTDFKIDLLKFILLILIKFKIGKDKRSFNE